jgi:hypothetical protein
VLVVELERRPVRQPIEQVVGVVGLAQAAAGGGAGGATRRRASG